MDTTHIIPPKDKAFQVMMSKDDRQRLDDLAAVLGITRSVIIRKAIQNTWSMVCAKQPLCANGDRCMVPQMHTNLQASHFAQMAPLATGDSTNEKRG